MARPATKSSKSAAKSIIELVATIAIAIALALLIQAFIVKPYRIPRGSMEPTLHGCSGCTGDRIMVDTLTYRFSSPQPGEVVADHIRALQPGPLTDVVSTDQHTVKPWFEGKIPFSFNLPEVQRTPYVLIGGRVAYLHHQPAAQLIYSLRQHRISIFVQPTGSSGPFATAARFPLTTQSWQEHGFQYIAVTDTPPSELKPLVDMWRQAN